MSEVIVIQEGYAKLDNEGIMVANCSCSLIKTPEHVIIVDTLSPWDADVIQKQLKELAIANVDYVVSTHGHPDHTGNNHLFLNAKQHIVGFCIFNHDKYYIHPFEHGENYIIDESVIVTPTPGHTSEDVSVLVKGSTMGETVAIVGDLFECEDDLNKSDLWESNSVNPQLQAKHRLRILELANVIIPGHGPMFSVTQEHIRKAETDLARVSTSTSSTWTLK